MQDDTITFCNQEIFLNTDNDEISRLFLDKVASINFDFFSSEDIDFISTKEDSILRVSKFVGYNLCYYFIRLNYIRKLAVEKISFLKVRNEIDFFYKIFKLHESLRS